MGINRFFCDTTRLLLIGALILPLTALATFQPANVEALEQTETAQAIDVNHIISEFTAREAEARKAFEQYGYRCDLIVQTVRGSTVTGVYKHSTKIVLNKKGALETKAVSFDRNTMTELVVTPQDIENLSPKYQFALETVNAEKYKFTFVNRQTVNRIDSFLFKVEPKRLLFKDLLFNGHIWIRASDSKIFRMIGVAEQQGNQKFPVVETQRALFADQYFFPIELSADEEIKFSLGASVHIKMNARYTEYIKLK